MPAIVSRVVEVCIFRRQKEGPEYLLLRRSQEDAIYPGIWQLVTGSIHEGERATDAAKREMLEETGLALDRFWVVPFVNSFYVSVNDTVHMSPVFAAEVNPVSSVRLSNEHQDHKWCSFELAMDTLVWPGQRAATQLVHDYLVGGKEASRLLSQHV